MGKTWKLESIQNILLFGDMYAGGVVFKNDETSGKVHSDTYVTQKVITSQYHITKILFIILMMIGIYLQKMN